MAEKTQAEWIIYKYATEHPELNQKQVAAATGYHQSLVSRTWHKFLAERIRHINKDEPTDMEKRIIAYYHAHPGIMQKDIAAALHCHRSSVSWTIGKYITGAVRRKQRNYSRKKEKLEALPEGSYTFRTCLKCDRKFKSTWSGHRLCPNCAENLEYQYVPDHRVYVEGNGRV